MAEVHINQDVTRGIKLFGKTISLQERKVKDEEEPAVKVDDQNTDKRPDKVIACPRCKSMETKFCYFNNYNVNQPRHFCRGCQRYWTAGGALRNVPVGAGRRRTKPPCRGLVGFQEGCDRLFDVSSGMRQFDFDGMVEEWHMTVAAAAQVEFRHVFPAKRRKSISGGESC